MDRLLARGHGSAVYGYGWGWFVRCLRAADAADRIEARRHRLERAEAMIDIRVAMHGDKDAFERHFDALVKEK